MTIDGMNDDQSWAFIEEMTSTRNLLAYGIDALRSAPFVETTLDPVLSLLSIGVEKHLKLTLGVIALTDDGAWPSFTDMRRYGHGITAMFGSAMTMIRERTLDKSEYVKRLVQEVDDDRILLLVLAALDRYANEGRFHNIDRLAERLIHDDAPRTYWRAVDAAVGEDPTVQPLFALALRDPSDQAAWDALNLAVQERAAISVERLWKMICAVGVNHALGPTGRTMGFELSPDMVGRQR